MNESSEQSGGPKLPFKLRDADDSLEQETDPQTLKQRDVIKMLNPDEVRFWKSMGITPELVEPTQKAGIELSQPTTDKE